MKKSTILLLIILGLIMIGGGLWFYFSTQKELIPDANITDQAELERVYQIKDLSVQNVLDFLKTPADPASIWEDLLAKKQFQDLEEREIEINLEGVGNTRPFDVPVPVQPEEE